MPLSSLATVTVPHGMDEGTELEFMRVQVKDLSEKLETLRLLFLYLIYKKIDTTDH